MQLKLATHTTPLPLYLVTALLARLADEGVRVAFVLGAAGRGLSIGQGGFLVAAFLLPHVLAAPLMGNLADRSRHKVRLYALAYLWFGASLLACGLLMGQAPFVVLLLIAVSGGSVGPLITGGLSSLLGGLVPPGRLSRAYSLDVSTYNLAGIAAPALVALLLGVWGSLPTIALLACGMGLAALGVALLPLNVSAVQTSERNLLAGVTALWRNIPLRATSLAAGLASVGMGALPVALALLAQADTNLNPGLLLSVTAVGALTGSLVYSLFPLGASRPEQLVLAGAALSGVPFVLLLLNPNPLWTALLLALVGLISGPAAASQFAVREREAAPEVKTQVFALASGLKVTIAALGAALAGVLAPLGGVPLLALIAVSYFAAALVGWSLLRSQPSRTA